MNSFFLILFLIFINEAALTNDQLLIHYYQHSLPTEKDTALKSDTLQTIESIIFTGRATDPSHFQTLLYNHLTKRQKTPPSTALKNVLIREKNEKMNEPAPGTAFVNVLIPEKNKKVDENENETILSVLISEKQKTFAIINAFGVNLNTESSDSKQIKQMITQNISETEAIKKKIIERASLWFETAISLIINHQKNNSKIVKNFFVIPRIGMQIYAGNYAIDSLYYNIFFNLIFSFQQRLEDHNIKVIFSLFDEAEGIVTYIAKNFPHQDSRAKISKLYAISRSTESMYNQTFMDDVIKEENQSIEKQLSLKEENQSIPKQVLLNTENTFFVFCQGGNKDNQHFSGSGMDKAIHQDITCLKEPLQNIIRNIMPSINPSNTVLKEMETIKHGDYCMEIAFDKDILNKSRSIYSDQSSDDIIIFYSLVAIGAIVIVCIFWFCQESHHSEKSIVT